MARRRKSDRVRESEVAYRGDGPGPFLLDSSVWIEFLRGSGHAGRTRADALLDARQARLSWIVVGELMHGTRSAEERRMITDLTATVPFLGDRPDLWAEAGRVANRIGKNGRRVRLADCYLGVLARAHAAILITRDRDFELIGSDLKIPVEIL